MKLRSWLKFGKKVARIPLLFVLVLRDHVQHKRKVAKLNEAAEAERLDRLRNPEKYNQR